MFFVFHRICSDDCVGGGQGKLSKSSEAFRKLSKAEILAPEGVWGRIYVKSRRFCWFFVKNTHFTTKNSWFRVIFSDFRVNYDVFCDFRCLRESARRALRRSGAQNGQNEAFFKRKHIQSWAGLQKLKSGLQRVSEENLRKISKILMIFAEKYAFYNEKQLI